jgi:hypothetical protein
MKDYSNFPDPKHLMRVLKHCPKSAYLYTELWKKKSKSNNFSINKKDIRKNYFISPTMFRNLLAPLMFLNLIVFIEKDDKFQIDIIGSHVDEE